MTTTHVAALRSTWRATAEQRAAQAWRILRLFGAALVAQVIAQLTANGFDLGKITHLDQKAVVALLVAAAEAAWRQLHPALTASAVDSAPGATIVPAQVGETPDPAPLPEAPDDTVNVDSIPADLPDAGAVEPGLLALGLVIALFVAFLLTYY